MQFLARLPYETTIEIEDKLWADHVKKLGKNKLLEFQRKDMTHVDYSAVKLYGKRSTNEGDLFYEWAKDQLQMNGTLPDQNNSDG